MQLYRGLLYSAQNTVKKDPGRARQNNVATAGTHFTKPGAYNKGDLCIVHFLNFGDEDDDEKRLLGLRQAGSRRQKSPRVAKKSCFTTLHFPETG